MPVRAVRLYGKPGCHLCEQAEELLEDLRNEFPHALISIDITSDQALFERYRYEIPVIALDNGQMIGGKVTEAQLRALLAS